MKSKWIPSKDVRQYVEQLRSRERNAITQFFADSLNDLEE